LFTAFAVPDLNAVVVDADRVALAAVIPIVTSVFTLESLPLVRERAYTPPAFTKATPVPLWVSLLLAAVFMFPGCNLIQGRVSMDAPPAQYRPPSETIPVAVDLYVAVPANPPVLDVWLGALSEYPL
jgi:hypothetical protein